MKYKTYAKKNDHLEGWKRVYLRLHGHSKDAVKPTEKVHLSLVLGKCLQKDIAMDWEDRNRTFYLPEADTLQYYVFLCGSVVEHCVSSAKGCGFDSQGTHILIKNV